MTGILIAIVLLALAVGALYLHSRAKHRSLQQDIDVLLGKVREELRGIDERFENVEAKLPTRDVKTGRFSSK